MYSVLTLLRDDRGSQTIEFVLWIPIIGALMVLITDAFLLDMTHTEMWNVARDTARRMTTKNLLTKAEAYASAQLTFFEYPLYTVNATYDEGTAMEVIVTLGVGDTSFFGFSNTQPMKFVLLPEVPSGSSVVLRWGRK